MTILSGQIFVYEKFPKNIKKVFEKKTKKIL